MFIIPAKLDFLNAFSSDPSKRPVAAGPGLINWKIIQSKMHWAFLFVLGGGAAIATAITSSGLSTTIGDKLSALSSLNPVAALFVICAMIQVITELTASVAVANIVLPIVAELVSKQTVTM